MNQKLPQPKDGDVVLGGTSIDISTAVVLGGIEGVKRDLQSNIESVQLSGLQKALNYAKEGIALIQQILKHPNVSLRLKAFELLKGQSTYLQQAQEHEQLKKTGWGNGNISKQKKEDDFRITEEQSCRLGEALVIELNKIYQATPTDSQISELTNTVKDIQSSIGTFTQATVTLAATGQAAIISTQTLAQIQSGNTQQQAAATQEVFSAVGFSSTNGNFAKP
jgi:hypothetical protein